MTPRVRIDRLRAGLYQVLGAELAPAGVSWGRGSHPQHDEGQDWASLQILQGPSPYRWSRARGHLVNAVASSVITVAEVAEEGDSAFATVNLQRFRFDLGEEDNAETARDGLIALIVAALGTYGVNAVAVPYDEEDPEAITGRFTVTGDTAVDLYQVSAEGAASAVNTAGVALEFTSGLAYSRIELQTFSKTPETGAAELAAAAQIALLTTQTSDRLYAEYAVALGDRSAGITDLSQIADGDWESRASLVFGAFQLGVNVKLADVIETVNVRTNVGDVVVTLTAPF